MVSYKFFTDTTGNNHQVVRHILKRRTWLQLMDNLKSPAIFDQTCFFWTQWKKQNIVEKITQFQIYAKIEGNGLLTNKANLLTTMIYFFKDRFKKTKKGPKDPFHLLPLTYNIKSSKRMEENASFQELKIKINSNKSRSDQQSIWICKPGENANRGNGIVVLPNIEQVQKFLQQTKADEPWVVQKYINHPLLIGGRFWHESPFRKFDIRMFALAQIVDGIHYRGYFYKEGYIRTSSFEYDIEDLSDRDIHLTNDAVQQDCREYGKYEQGNKISFKDFAQYLQNFKKVDFFKVIYPQMREAIKNTLEAFWTRLQNVQPVDQIQKEKINNQFELLGYDFMIDNDLNVYLIEVNTNPCLDTSPCPLLQRLITQVLDQSFKIAVDPFLQGRDIQYAQAQEMSLTELQYEMIVSNQPEVALKFQTLNQPMVQQVPSSKFITLAPLVTEVDQKGEKILKAPTTPLSPLESKKSVNNRKNSKLIQKKSQSKDYSTKGSIQNGTANISTKKRNNTLSRASSTEQRDEEIVNLSQKTSQLCPKTLMLPEFSHAKKETLQAPDIGKRHNDISQIRGIYSQNNNNIGSNNNEQKKNSSHTGQKSKSSKVTSSIGSKKRGNHKIRQQQPS